MWHLDAGERRSLRAGDCGQARRLATRTRLPLTTGRHDLASKAHAESFLPTVVNHVSETKFALSKAPPPDSKSYSPWNAAKGKVLAPHSANSAHASGYAREQTAHFSCGTEARTCPSSPYRRTNLRISLQVAKAGICPSSCVTEVRNLPIYCCTTFIGATSTSMPWPTSTTNRPQGTLGGQTPNEYLTPNEPGEPAVSNTERGYQFTEAQMHALVVPCQCAHFGGTAHGMEREDIFRELARAGTKGLKN